MKVIFLGVGEACDERWPNTSVWVQTRGDGQRRSILMDCGFSVPPCYWRQINDPEDLDLLWISHFHGDHFFGMPALLLRMWEMKRSKPLIVLGQTGVRQLLHSTMELAYPGFLQKLTYPLDCVEVEPGQTGLQILGLAWEFAESSHGQRDLAVRLEDRHQSLFYSGDGLPTAETQLLARGCDLVIHEAFHLDRCIPGHGSVGGSIAFARNAGAAILALVHLQRDVRRKRHQDVLDLMQKTEDLQVLLPDAGDVVEL